MLVGITPGINPYIISTMDSGCPAVCHETPMAYVAFAGAAGGPPPAYRKWLQKVGRISMKRVIQRHVDELVHPDNPDYTLSIW